MDALTATTTDCNANDDIRTSSAEATADSDHRPPRARCGFGFKPPQPKHGRPGPASRTAAQSTMPLPPPTRSGVVTEASDGTAAEDDGRPSVNGDVGHLLNGVGGDNAPALTRGPPTTSTSAAKKDGQRQTAIGRNKQSALRRPAKTAQQSSRAGCPQQRRVGKATASDGVAQASDGVTLVNGGASGASVPLNGRQKPAPDKSVKLLVNYRSTNHPHSQLQSAYGNRDFFGPSSTRGSADAAPDVPQSGTEDVGETAASSQSGSVLSHCLLLSLSSS